MDILMGSLLFTIVRNQPLEAGKIMALVYCKINWQNYCLYSFAREKKGLVHHSKISKQNVESANWLSCIRKTEIGSYIRNRENFRVQVEFQGNIEEPGCSGLENKTISRFFLSLVSKRSNNSEMTSGLRSNQKFIYKNFC